MHELEIVQYVVKWWYVLWYTKVKDISDLYIYMCIYTLCSQIIHVTCGCFIGNGIFTITYKDLYLFFLIQNKILIQTKCLIFRYTIKQPHLMLVKKGLAELIKEYLHKI